MSPKRSSAGCVTRSSLRTGSRSLSFRNGHNNSRIYLRFRYAPAIAFLTFLIFGVSSVDAQENTPPTSDDYALTPDSSPHAGVPAGATFQFEMKNSQVF